MTYYMLGFELGNRFDVEDINRVLIYKLTSTYSPHLWNSVITYNLLGWRGTILLREASNLPPEQYSKIVSQALTALEGL